MRLSPAARWTGLAFVVLLLNSAYLAAFATPSIGKSGGLFESPFAGNSASSGSLLSGG